MSAAQHMQGPWLLRSKDLDAVYTAPPAGSPYQFGEHVFTFHDEEGPSGEALALILAAPELLADLILAAETLRRYEVLHNAKGTAESTAKAEANAALAARFEATIAKATGEAA